MIQLFEEAEAFQNMLVSIATGGSEDSSEFTRLRQSLVSNSSVESHLPRFVRTCRSTDQFWQFIKHKFGTYAERREYIWGEFASLLELLERGTIAPHDVAVAETFVSIDATHIQATWSKALDRRTADPEGAITIARTLLETVCKHILEEDSGREPDVSDITKLYKETANVLNLAPSQHTEQVFKQILGGCTAVVEGLGSLRNKLSDSHGRSRQGVKPAPRHAELAVNLSGALASYLLATWNARSETET